MFSTRPLQLQFLLAVLAPSLGLSELDWRKEANLSSAPLSFPTNTQSGFKSIAPSRSGVEFENRLADSRSITNQVFLNGSGVAAGDLDGDDRVDLYFCGLDAPNALYLNQGDLQFLDATASSQTACADQASTGCAFADMDGDGDLDLLVMGLYSGVRLFLNDGRAHFNESTSESGLRSRSGFTTPAIADIDGDGWLDLYVANYRNDTIRDFTHQEFIVNRENGNTELISFNGKPANHPDLVGRFDFDSTSGVLENGEPDAFYRNLGNGRFEAVPWASGMFLGADGKPVPEPYDWGLAALFQDLNGDRHPDLYVCNDFQSPDRIWINNGKGQFQAISQESIRQTSLFSMGVDFADINGDGLVDGFVADMLSPNHARRQVQVMDATAFSQIRATTLERPQFSRNSLYLNRGDSTYAEISQFAGVHASDWSWCPIFMDVDMDGRPDLLVTTGHWRDAQNADVAMEIETTKRNSRLSPREELGLRLKFPRLNTPNHAYRNRGDLTFEDQGEAWGFDSTNISQGMAQADLDGDGDLDLVINCLNAKPLLYQNTSPRSRIAIRLRSSSPNTHGIGSIIRVEAPGLPTQTQEIISGGRYLSSDEPMRQFAVQSPHDRITVEVRWRSGKTSRYDDLEANRIYQVFEPEVDTPVTNTIQMPPDPHFEEVSAILDHTHHAEPVDDFSLHPLLPFRLSHQGSGATWFDFNGDGWDDILLGTGRGGKMAAFRNDQNGGFVRQKASILATLETMDQTMVLGYRPKSDDIALLIGYSNFRTPPKESPALGRLSLVTGKQDKDLLLTENSIGPLAMADINQDGDLDLFVGGRALAGRYPKSTDSFLWHREENRFVKRESASDVFKDLGMVNGARFADLNGDGRPELVVAREWDSIAVFKNHNGDYQPWNPAVRWASDKEDRWEDGQKLSHLKGLWTSVAAGDFNNDGRLDLVVGNWGRNHTRHDTTGAPARLYYPKDHNAPGQGLIESSWDPQLSGYVPVRDRNTLSASFPSLMATFGNFTGFSKAGISELLESDLPQMEFVEAGVFDSVVLLNLSDGFEIVSLPQEAQFAPVFGISTGDFDGDGNTDLFLAQNFFGTSPAESRMDAGCGLWLRGTGRGGFRTVPANQSGFGIYGEGRGSAVCDYDHDGRLDLIVTQYQGPTKLFRNRKANPGIRIRLQGPARNPQAIGAGARLKYSDGTRGPLHEVSLGTGYLSQDSNEFILGTPKPVSEIEIHWPDGTRESKLVQNPQPHFVQYSFSPK